MALEAWFAARMWALTEKDSKHISAWGTNGSSLHMTETGEIRTSEGMMLHQKPGIFDGRSVESFFGFFPLVALVIIFSMTRNQDEDVE